MGRSDASNSMRDAVSFFPGSWRKLPGGSAVLLAQQCDHCGTLYFPAVPVCAQCHLRKFSAIELSPRATLYSYSTIHVERQGFSCPYTVGFADFPEGVRVFGQVACDDVETLAPDMPVSLEIRTLFVRDGTTPVVGHVFVPHRE